MPFFDELPEAQVDWVLGALVEEEHARLLQRFEAEQRARAIVVPTASGEVRARLRALGQPHE